MTADDFRRIALSFAGAEEGSHMGAADFRVGGRIFATLATVDKGYGNLMLDRERQKDFVQERPDVFLPVHGGWGRNGATHMRLNEADEHLMRGALEAAWRLRLDANSKARKRAPAKRKRPQ